MQQLYLHQSDNSFVYVCLFYVVMFQGPAQLSIACSMHMDGESLGMKLLLSMGPHHLCFGFCVETLQACKQAHYTCTHVCNPVTLVQGLPHNWFSCMHAF